MTSKTAPILIFLGLLLVGIFPVGASAAANQATFLRTDTTTQGNWKGVYGLDGYVIPGSSANQVPGYAAFTPANAAIWTWTNDGNEVRDLQVSWTDPQNTRQASCWYTSSSNSYSLDVDITDGKTHQFALYLLDWDRRGRTETIQAADGTSGTVLDSRSASNFGSGIYYIWTVSGHVKFNVTLTGGVNAVVSGAFFDSATTNSAPGIAHFVTTDTSTQGNWHGIYGSDGYSVEADSQIIPSYSSLTVMNQMMWTWATGTSDPRALQLGSGLGRIAATWYNTPTFSIDVNITDGNSHQVALYSVDWDGLGRAQTIQVVDAQTQAVLDSRNISNFVDGIYVVWSVSGHVRFNVMNTAGKNAVVSGVFFGGSGGLSSVGGTAVAPATVTVTLPVSVSLTPSSVSLSQGQTASFVASVQDSANQSVSWSLNPNLGTISSSGVYTAPATITSAQTVTVTATSVATPAGSASATVTLTPPVVTPAATTGTPSASTGTLPSGLVLHWTFDNANVSGTSVQDTSNNGGTGTLSGTTVVPGKINQAFGFNGVNSYVWMSAFTDTAVAFNNNITVAAWIKTSNTTRIESIISKFSAAGNAAGYIFETDAAGHLEFRVGGADIYAYPGSVADTATVNDGQWHHVAAVVTVGQGVQFYVDGKLSSTAAMSLWAGGDGWADLVVGSCSYTSYAQYFTGDIDDVQLYSRALSAAEISSVFSAAGASGAGSTVQTQTTSSQSGTVTQGYVTVSPATFNFGNVNIGSSTSQTFSVSNSGNGTVTISNVSVSGAGLNATGVPIGTVLSPGQSATLTVTYTPAAAVGLTGSVTFTSNASNASMSLTLTGTGVQPPPVVHSVVLTWGASVSAGVVGYDVYRGTVSGGPYTLMTSTPVSGMSYTDASGQVGQTYYYVVTSVDSSNTQSGYSNVVSITIP